MFGTLAHVLVSTINNHAGSKCITSFNYRKRFPRISLSLSLSLSIYIYIYMCAFIYLLGYKSIYLSVCVCVYIYTCSLVKLTKKIYLAVAN